VTRVEGKALRITKYFFAVAGASEGIIIGSGSAELLIVALVEPFASVIVIGPLFSCSGEYALSDILSSFKNTDEIPLTRP
jgi:hypothetical protein